MLVGGARKGVLEVKSNGSGALPFECNRHARSSSMQRGATSSSSGIQFWFPLPVQWLVGEVPAIGPFHIVLHHQYRRTVFADNGNLTHWVTGQCVPMCTTMMPSPPCKRLMAQGSGVSKRCCVKRMFQPTHTMHRVRWSAIPVYMVDTPVADYFSMSSCSHSDTASLLSVSYISISSGCGVGHRSLRRLRAPCFSTFYGLAFGSFWLAMFEVVIAPDI